MFCFRGCNPKGTVNSRQSRDKRLCKRAGSLSASWDRRRLTRAYYNVITTSEPPYVTLANQEICKMKGGEKRLCGFILGNMQGQNLLCDLSARRQKKKRCDVEKSGCDYLWLVILLCEITSDNKTHQRSRCRQAAPWAVRPLYRNSTLARHMWGECKI